MNSLVTLVSDNHTLLAVLLNPPAASSGGRTLEAVRGAARVLGFEDVKTTNLFTEATPTVVELNRSTGFASWSVTQDEIEALFCGVGGVLAAWGVSGASGKLRCEREKRGAWLLAKAAVYGHTSVWMVGGEPRHPSRWHQYVADKHQRTLGGTLGERLAQVLVAVPVTDAVAMRDQTHALR